jgi:hypothetical protein
LCWLKKEAPVEARLFWQKEYPAMATVDDRLEAIKASGYEIVAHFSLPESAWWNDYYRPLEDNLSVLREKYRDRPTALQAMAGTQQEIDMYRAYADFYGYVFFIMQKDGG